jgi:hypothetical protein
MKSNTTEKYLGRKKPNTSFQGERVIGNIYYLR